MIEWLLKEEEKAKVGRPKLADNGLLKKANALLATSFVLVFVMGFCFVSYINGKSPSEFAYKIAANKLSGLVVNKNGFNVKESYVNSDYKMKINIPKTVSKYQGSYKYSLYKLTKNSWKLIDSKTYERDTKSFDIDIKTKKNKNETYKVQINILNSAKINTSFAPFSWEFVDSEKNEEKYAYKIFTVSGYYSPINNSESKEIKEKKDKVNITTNKNEPRTFILNNNSLKYSLSVYYTDEANKKIELKKVEDALEPMSFTIPNINKITSVTFKIWLKDLETSKIDDYKLSNWIKEKDKDGNYYITTTYLLKPEKSYRLK